MSVLEANLFGLNINFLDRYNGAFIVRDNYFRMRLIFRNIKNRLKYDAPVKIYMPIKVAPNDIIYTISWNEIEDKYRTDMRTIYYKRKPELAGTVLGGDWDLGLKKFENSVVYKSFFIHFVDGTPWNETELYLKLIEKISAFEGQNWWDCKSEEDLIKRCENLDILFNLIKKEGYKSQKELSKNINYPVTFKPPRNNPINQIIENEIAIDIGRNGQLIFVDGRNRLSIAKILGLESIPVIVLVRHKQWQQLRDKIVRGETNPSQLLDKIRNHQDIIDLI